MISVPIYPTREQLNWQKRSLRSWGRQRSSAKTPCSQSGRSADPVWRMRVKPSTPPPAAGALLLSILRYKTFLSTVMPEESMCICLAEGIISEYIYILNYLLSNCGNFKHYIEK